MSQLLRAYIDKSSWGKGPWHVEADTLVWADSDTGLCCVIQRHPSLGHLCGYVGTPLALLANEDPNALDVHGGITYHERRAPTEDEYLPETARGLFWVGFDCGHSKDLSPGLLARYPDHTRPRGQYRDIGFVESEVQSLARQLYQCKSPLWWLAQRAEL